MDYRNYQQVISLSNDLSKLIPVGTLHFYNLPNTKTDLGGLPCNNEAESQDNKTGNDWKWLDIDFLIQICNNKVHPLLLDIQFLMIFRYIMATYKIIRLGDLLIAKVRIFAIPLDMEGSRFFIDWRSTRRQKLDITRRHKRAWLNLMRLLDFSPSNWTKLNLNRLLLLPCISSEQPETGLQSENNEDLNFHLDRWSTNSGLYLPKDDSDETLTQKILTIYNSIPSPDVSKYYNKSISRTNTNLVPSSEDTIIGLINNMLDGNNSIPGVKTQLYPFQIKSLTKMYEKESIPGKTLVPNFLELKAPCSETNYYFDITTFELYMKPELFQQPRGGILAENMGLGKTLICLSLICLTKWEISTLPKDYLIFVENKGEEEEEKVSNDGHVLQPATPIEPSPVKKLADFCKDCIAQNSLPWKYYINDLPESVISILNSSPGYFRIPLENSEYLSPFSVKRSRRSERIKFFEREIPMEGKHFRTLYYCNTTLIVVPDNLFHQWNTELKKHIHGNYLKKLFISNQFKKKIETDEAVFTNEVNDDPKYLIKFDLIVVSLSILSKQFEFKEDNAFLNIFWKRLIIDEGHSMNSKSSRAGLLCREMHSERRWAVTGTPTSGLTRLHMDEEDEEGKSVEDSPSKRKNKYVVKNQFNERDDLVKLGNIMSNFLKIEPFHSQPKLWQSTMIRPLLTNVYGSSSSLSHLLNSTVVRHSLDEVERDIKLPQLHHVSVFLKPSFHNKLAINIFTSVLAVNAVSSERKDIDYMFHPANRQQLRRLITNLQRATFHWTGFKQEDIEALIHICKVSLQKRKANGQSVYNKKDLNLLEKSMETAQSALNNQRWRTIALLHEMNYYVDGLPDVFTKTFGTGVLESTKDDGSQNDIGIFGAPHINSLQEFFYKNRFMDMNNDNLLIEKLEAQSKPFWENYWKDTMRKNTQKFNKQDKNEDFNTDIVQQRVINAVDAPNVRESPKKNAPNGNGHKRRNLGSNQNYKEDMKKLNEQSRKELGREDGEGLKITNEVNTLYSLARHNISYDKIKNATILGTASSKLSYLSSKLLENQQEKTKSIVFFEFEDSAYYLTELLDILGVNYILYATFINPAQRAANLSEFSDFPSEKDGGITLIMDLRLASHGLTIIAATKVYFISPVWQRSVEAQAIKRAHRIGQTEEVYVETLVLEDTLEEEIYRKRLKEGQEEDTSDAKKKYVIDDTGMQDFILRHNFLPVDPNEPEYSPFVASTNNKEAYIKKEEFDDPSALSQHEDSVYTNDHNQLMRQWEVFLFNGDNLAKLNSLKNQKLTKEFLKNQFIKSMVYDKDDEEDEEMNRRRKRKKEGPARKKVRF